MTIDKLICIPELHKELLPCPLPAGVMFMQPGILDAQAIENDQFTPSGFPYASPTAARAVLREMLEIGNNLGTRTLRDGKLFAPAENQSKNMAGRDEKNALEQFALNGSVSSKRTEDATCPPAALHDCQKILLLAWELERNLLEIRAAEQVLAEKNRLLNEFLGGEQDFDEQPSYTAPHSTGNRDNSPIALPWKRVLEAAAAFIPDNFGLISFRREIYEELEESGLLMPLTDEVKRELETVTAELKHSCGANIELRSCIAPLWKILGIREPESQEETVKPGTSGTDLLERKPWLGKTYHLLVAANCPC